MSSPANGISKAGTAAVLLLAAILPSGPARAGRPATPSLGFVDVEDPYTTSPSLKACFKELGISAQGISTSGNPDPAKMPGVFIGSFATADRKAGRALKGNFKRLMEYVGKGGVLVVFGQADEDESELVWLPEPLAARRVDRDSLVAHTVDATHPLLTTPNVLDVDALMHGEVFRGKYKYAPSVYAATDLFAGTSGFHTVLSAGQAGEFPVLMVARHGSGAVVLMAMSPDRLCAVGKSEADRAAGKAMVENLARFAKSPFEPAWNETPTPFALPGQEAHRVEVFWDPNGNGTREEGEEGIENVVVTCDLTDRLTDASGTAEVPVDPARAGLLSIRLPAGTVATKGWFASSRELGPHRFGLLRQGSRAANSTVLFHLTDTHIGRTVAADDAVSFRQFQAQLAHRAGPGDLFVFTGDLTHTGSPSELALLAQGFRPIENPLLAVMGNHDWNNGPDKGRLFEEFIGPARASLEWNGLTILSLPQLEGSSAERQWLDKSIADSKLPVVILVHLYPTRKAMDRLDRTKVRAVLSGHWHGDLVSFRNGIADINGPTALIGGWDFSPGSARRIWFEEDRVSGAETIPFVKWPVAAVVAVGKSTLLCNRLGNVDEAGLDTGSSWKRFGMFAWLTQVENGSRPYRCGGDDDPMVEVVCAAGDAASCATGGTPTTRVKWAAKVPGLVLLASPTVSGASLLVPFRDGGKTGFGGGVCALNRDDGKVQWCHETAASVTVDPALAGGTVQFSEVDGTLWGISSSSGAPLWTTRLDEVIRPEYSEHFIHSSAVLHGGKAYYCYQRGAFGVRMGDGRIDWYGEAFGGADSFNHAKGVVAGGFLYCGAFMGSLVRFDLKGKSPVKPEKLGRFDINADLDFDQTVRVLTRDSLLQLDPLTAAVLKKVRTPYTNLPANFIPLGDSIVIPDENTGLKRIVVDTGKTAWRRALEDGPMAFALNRRESAGIIGSPTASGNTVYVPGVDGILRALDAAKGTVQKTWQFGVPLVSAPEVSGTTLFVADYGGTVYAIGR